ncbi:hypothetical protein ACE41U_25655, partial [Shigella flexneri]|uniref:hypothetical protein n=1 Tax=Shigella flexneri TaxID=623 RepID=UPI0035CD1F5E
ENGNFASIMMAAVTAVATFRGLRWLLPLPSNPKILAERISLTFNEQTQAICERLLKPPH